MSWHTGFAALGALSVPALGAVCLATLGGCSSRDIVGAREPEVVAPEPGPNVLDERLGEPVAQTNQRIDAAYEQLFFGDPTTEAVFRDLGDGTAYIEDIFNADVRTDSMGYGMMVTVQLGEQTEFDKLWAWVKRHMLNTSGPAQGLLNWRCETDGTGCATTAATDAMSVIATSLFMAGGRWRDSGGHAYVDDAHALLDVMRAIETRNGGVVDGVTNCFDAMSALPRRGSSSQEDVTPTDYLMPAFYEYWAVWRSGDRSFWLRAADASRSLLRQLPHPQTGLFPQAVHYDGTPVLGEEHYRADTSRALLNLTLDHIWFGPSTWIAEQNERRLDFFLAEGLDSYASEYSTDGQRLVDYNTAAHRSLVALAAGTSREPRHDVFLEVLLAEQIPTGEFRYFDGMLYLLSLVILSGQSTALGPT